MCNITKTCRVLLYGLTFLSFIGLYAQKDSEGIKGPDGFIRCSTVEYNNQLEKDFPDERLSKEDFENWLAPKIEEYKNNKEGFADIITIPVVVHVIHNGDPVNQSEGPLTENISYEQAISQVQVLNEDFRRLAGTPGSGISGYELGVDVEVEFCLATIDPNGAATNGVNRVNLCQPNWSRDDIEAIVKPETIWNAEEYLNMWSVRFSNTQLLGYAQFPSASGLPGMPSNGGSALTDGVVANFNVFGTIANDDGSFILNNTYNLGRTMTHEVGHWLGLRHIWGDGNCSQDDFCADTPDSDSPNFQCNQAEKCGSPDMTENYMDYTIDSCMDTFTEDQKVRMLTVLENSPRRNTLNNSTKCDTPVGYNLDAEVKLTCAEQEPCVSGAILGIELINKGLDIITEVEIEYSANGLEIQTYQWTGSLNQFEMESIELPSIEVTSGNNNIEVEVISVNGGQDELSENNISNKSYVFAGNVNEFNSTNYELSITPDNYGSEITWELKNSSGELLYSGGPYEDDNTDEILVDLVLEDEDCFVFTIFDEFGDGICCDFGIGFYELTTEAGDEVLSGGDYGDSETSSFTSVPLLSNQEFNSFEGIKLYPNPTNGSFQISNIQNISLKSIIVFNVRGQVILEKEVSDNIDLKVDLSDKVSGVYFVKVNSTNSSNTFKVIKE